MLASAPATFTFKSDGLYATALTGGTWLRVRLPTLPVVLHAGRRPSVPTGALLEKVWASAASDRAARGQKSESAVGGGELPAAVAKEAHKYFDQVSISVRSGDGGNGATLQMPKASAKPAHLGKNARAKLAQKGKTPVPGRSTLKRGEDGSVVLPMGGHGGDVLIFADEYTDTLLDLHQRKKYAAKRGGNVDTVEGLTRRVHDGFPGTVLRIPVPCGTVVKRKKGSKLVADLARPGDQVVVARGGRGGISILSSGKKYIDPETTPGVEMADDKSLIRGLPGEEAALELTLRVVADVGLVGLPNAGKSSLLAASTAATPAIAAYPFTTLMPNLGRMPGDPSGQDGGMDHGATLADLPGIIEGAHIGRGLGRMFLRHLRRTRLLVHIVDGAAEDPLKDYYTLREAKERFEAIREGILGGEWKWDEAERRGEGEEGEEGVEGGGFGGEGHGGGQLPVLEGFGELEGEAGVGGGLAKRKKERGGKGGGKEEERETPSPPLSVVAISAKEHDGVDALLAEIRKALADVEGTKESGAQSRREGGGKEGGGKVERMKAPQWQI